MSETSAAIQGRLSKSQAARRKAFKDKYSMVSWGIKQRSKDKKTCKDLLMVPISYIWAFFVCIVPFTRDFCIHIYEMIDGLISLSWNTYNNRSEYHGFKVKNSGYSILRGKSKMKDGEELSRLFDQAEEEESRNAWWNKSKRKF